MSKYDPELTESVESSTGAPEFGAKLDRLAPSEQLERQVKNHGLIAQRKPTALAAGFSGSSCLEAQVRKTPSHHLMALLLAGISSHAMGGNGWAA